MECIKPYLLVGGTALSLQLTTRQSEDLDFMSWRKSKNEKREVDWPRIKKELQTIGDVENADIIYIDHVEFIVNGVKLSFYANPKYSPVKQEMPFLNNLRLADLNSIGAIKNGSSYEQKQIQRLLRHLLVDRGWVQFKEYDGTCLEKFRTQIEIKKPNGYADLFTSIR